VRQSARSLPAAKGSHRRGDENLPGALRGLCSTLKDKVNAVHQDVEAMGTARYITLRREPQARNR
jgi:hypothetical protein